MINKPGSLSEKKLSLYLHCMKTVLDIEGITQTGPPVS